MCAVMALVSVLVTILDCACWVMQPTVGPRTLVMPALLTDGLVRLQTCWLTESRMRQEGVK